MIIKLTYVTLLLLMLFALFIAGLRLQKKYKIWSAAGLLAILVYTLNEGLRFGRGIDYNMGGIGYERFATYGGEYNNHIGFEYFVKALVSFDIPWQGCVMIMSCLFIVGLLFLMRSLKEVVPFALPLFVLVSSGTVENLFKWYMAYSFLMIGLSYQIEHLEKLNVRFVFFSCVATLFHIAFLPVPLVFYLLTKFKKPILSPLWSICLFFAIAFFFQTAFMLQFVDLINAASQLSDKFDVYANNAETWFTQGFQGRETRALPGMSELLFLICITLLGYKCLQYVDKKYTYIYNLFLLGLFLKPITNQIPLLARYDHVFFFFRAVMLACVLQFYYREKKFSLQSVWVVASSLIFYVWASASIRAPLVGQPERYLYVWNKGKLTYKDMVSILSENADEKSEKLKESRKN